MGRDSFDDAVTGMNNEDEENEDDDEDFPEIDDVDAPLDTDDDGEEDGGGAEGRGIMQEGTATPVPVRLWAS